MKRFLFVFFVATLLFLTSITTSDANHSWANYHWGRTQNPFTLKLGDNLSSAWDSYLATTSNDWSASSVLDTTIVSGLGGRNCKAQTGRIEVCNRTYGNNGWLGLAQIWVSGSHITKGVTKVNDTYFNTPTYNTPAWKNLVLCQEVGHTLGLDHQDEDFDNPNLGTCMDYTDNPNSNQHPNNHDYDMLEDIYTHLDTVNTVGQSAGQNAKQIAMEVSEDRGTWGKSLKDNGRVALFERDFGGGNKVFTFVIWAN